MSKKQNLKNCAFKYVNVKPQIL